MYDHIVYVYMYILHRHEYSDIILLKMHSATSSEGPLLVKIVVLCAQTRVAIEMHSRMVRSTTHFERPA